ncbi:uncharacterized protein HaLaN_29743, partial [Haematococcus lacustris]
EINELRREIRSLRGRAGGTGPTMPGLAGASMGPGASGAAGGRLGGPVAGPHAHDMTEGLRKELDMQRELISRMRDDANAKQARIRQLEAMAAPRPMSRDRLPPMPAQPPPYAAEYASDEDPHPSAYEPDLQGEQPNYEAGVDTHQEPESAEQMTEQATDEAVPGDGEAGMA